MKVECGDCPARYAVADERIAGKKVRLRCKRCGASIIVNGKETPPTISCVPASHPLAGEPSTAASSLPEARSAPLHGDLPPSRPPAPTILGGLEAPDSYSGDVGDPTEAQALDGFDSLLGRAPSSQRGLSIPAPQGTEEKFRVAITKDDLRWMSLREVSEALTAGALSAKSFVLVDPPGRWEMLRDVPALAELVGGDTAAAAAGANPSRTSCPPPSRRSRQPAAMPRALSGESSNEEGSSPEETVPFSLDPSRASNRPSFLQDTSFFAEAKRVAAQQQPARSNDQADTQSATGENLPLPPPTTAATNQRTAGAGRYVAALCLVASCGAVAAWIYRADLQKLLGP